MEPIQTLWTHGALGLMENLCLSSFMKHGHEVHLYTYDEVQNIPKGVIVKGGEEIIPRAYYDYRDFINNGTFADYFRYKLLFDRGGWWVDTDLICLKPFDFDAEHVFGEMGPWPGERAVIDTQVRLGRLSRSPSWARLPNPERCISNNCMKAPKRSQIVGSAWATCTECDPSTVAWSTQVGPGLIDKLVKFFKKEDTVKDTRYFNPVDHQRVRDFSDPRVKFSFGPETYAVHLWSDLWNGRTNWKGEQTWQKTGCAPILQSKEVVVPGSLYHALVARYLWNC